MTHIGRLDDQSNPFLCDKKMDYVFIYTYRYWALLEDYCCEYSPLSLWTFLLKSSKGLFPFPLLTYLLCLTFTSTSNYPLYLLILKG